MGTGQVDKSTFSMYHPYLKYCYLKYLIAHRTQVRLRALNKFLRFVPPKPMSCARHMAVSPEPCQSVTAVLVSIKRWAGQVGLPRPSSDNSLASDDIA